MIDTTNNEQLAQILLALLLASNKSLSINRLHELLAPEQVNIEQVRQGLSFLKLELESSLLPLELRVTASGYRLQFKASISSIVARLWEERTQKYSRALLETLALVAYRQPVTRAEIEDVRGVMVSSHIIKTLQERNWIKVVGHKEVPGRPAMFATTKEFLDYFCLTSLDELPPLQEVRDLGVALAKLQDSLVQNAAATLETDSSTQQEQKEEDINPLRELSFSSLLAELEEMESDLKTNFDDWQQDEPATEIEEQAGSSTASIH